MQQKNRKIRDHFLEEDIDLSMHHEDKFKEKLFRELHPKKSKVKTFQGLSIAASILLLISFGFYFQITDKPDTITEAKKSKLSLGTISPELKSIETYYINNINLEISQIEMRKENKEILDGYLGKIGELTKEYKLLTQELNKNGINDATIEALISNLQLRLQLLKRLRKQLKNLKKINSDETQII